MFLRFSVVLFFTCLASCLWAQDQYVVKFNGDTIRGKLQINPVRDNTRSMYFKNEDGSKENIRPVRISYVYYDEEYQFRSVAYFNQRLFMQIIKEDDHLSYYNYIHKRDNSISTTKVAIKSNGEALELSALTFKGQVKKFLEDCPEIAAKISNKEYRYKDHEQLFVDYNDCDLQVLVAVSRDNKSQENNPDAIGTGSVVAVTPAVTSDARAVQVAGNESKKAKLSKVDDFRDYVRSRSNLDQARDILEWLTDVEFRIIEDREIPNYLWSSLEEMSEDDSDLQQEAAALKADLQD